MQSLTNLRIYYSRYVHVHMRNINNFINRGGYENGYVWAPDALDAFQAVHEHHMVKMRPLYAADKCRSVEAIRSGQTAESLWLQKFDGWMRETRIPELLINSR